MSALDRIRYNPWTTSGVSGGLIVFSALISVMFGVNPFGSGHHDIGFNFDQPGALIVADALMIAAAIVAGTPIAIKAARALFARIVSIDLLVSIAAIGALIIGEYWESAAVTFLFAIGHALEARTMNKTRSALAQLVAVAPDTATVMRDGEQVEVFASSVQPGEIVLVKNGAKVPVDGVVVDGAGSLDEAPITGESLPVEKTVGDKVFAGTVSRGGFLQVETTGAGADTTLARIIHRVEEAQDAKARTQTFMERFSAWYTPGIIVLALAAGLISQSVVLGLTLLVIGCPGALVISIPVAVVAGIGRGARDGILIKGGEYLETSAKINAVALDKTGTLTEGKPQLTDVVVLDPEFTEDQVLGWAARAETGSEHPLSKPIIEAARVRGLSVSGLPEFTEVIPGKGIVAEFDGQSVAVGNRALIEDIAIEGAAEGLVTLNRVMDDLSNQGKTPMAIALDGRVIAVLAVADKLRVDAPEMISLLHSVGVKEVVMLTGDNERVARSVAAQVGVDQVRAGLLPEDKLEAIKALQAQGYTVAMVGDGINDAPALAVADVGIAMGAAGTGVAIETADIALMNDDLLKLPEAISLARRTVAVMRQNIAIALVTVVALLAGVFMGHVSMALGMLVHEGSVLLVIFNAMRLMRRPRFQRRLTSTPRGPAAGSTTGPTTSAVAASENAPENASETAPESAPATASSLSAA